MAKVLGKVATELASIGTGVTTDTGATASTSTVTAADRVAVTAAYSGIGYWG